MRLALVLLGAKVDDELVAVIPLSDGVDLVLPADDLADLAPRTGAELLAPHLPMPRQLDVLLRPGALVVRVHAEPDPHVVEPRHVLWVDGVGDAQPAVLDKVGALLGAQVRVLGHAVCLGGGWGWGGEWARRWVHIARDPEMEVVWHTSIHCPISGAARPPPQQHGQPRRRREESHGRHMSCGVLDADQLMAPVRRAAGCTPTSTTAEVGWKYATWQSGRKEYDRAGFELHERVSTSISPASTNQSSIMSLVSYSHLTQLTAARTRGRGRRDRGRVGGPAAHQHLLQAQQPSRRHPGPVEGQDGAWGV
jgi:hypothetical protein